MVLRDFAGPAMVRWMELTGGVAMNGRACLMASLLLAALTAGGPWARAPHPPPAAAAAKGCGGPGHCKKSWYGGHCPTCYARPYHTSSCLYGYQDYVYGR